MGKAYLVANYNCRPQKAIRDHVEAEDKRTERIVHPLGGEQDTLVINESGLYSLVLSSNLPNAKKFKRWVTSEVLPSKILKHLQSKGRGVKIAREPPALSDAAPITQKN